MGNYFVLKVFLQMLLGNCNHELYKSSLVEGDEKMFFNSPELLTMNSMI